jgi:hypothetical protein
MRGRIAAIVMSALLTIYLVAVVQYAFVLIGIDDWIARTMGVALLVLPLIGAWALVREIIFVLRAEKLMRTLRDTGDLPVDDLPKLPSGRADPALADGQFPPYKAAVEAAPESWQAWFRLGLAYDASGDRPRARWATREAIRLARAAQ